MGQLDLFTRLTCHFGNVSTKCYNVNLKIEIKIPVVEETLIILPPDRPLSFLILSTAR